MSHYRMGIGVLVFTMKWLAARKCDVHRQYVLVNYLWHCVHRLLTFSILPRYLGISQFPRSTLPPIINASVCAMPLYILSSMTLTILKTHGITQGNLRDLLTKLNEEPQISILVLKAPLSISNEVRYHSVNSVQRKWRHF